MNTAMPRVFASCSLVVFFDGPLGTGVCCRADSRADLNARVGRDYFKDSTFSRDFVCKKRSWNGTKEFGSKSSRNFVPLRMFQR